MSLPISIDLCGSGRFLPFRATRCETEPTHLHLCPQSTFLCDKIQTKSKQLPQSTTLNPKYLQLQQLQLQTPYNPTMLVTEIFHDMTPIPQDDGPNPICQIDYPQEFDIAQSYLRAILQKKEHSERALQLTAYCLQFNPANYTTWWYRRQCLAALSSSSESMNHFDHTRIVKDLMLASKLGGSNPKNYQIWFHRRNLLEQVTHSFIENEHEDGLHLIQEELEYIASVLLMDAKNYHVSYTV